MHKVTQKYEMKAWLVTQEVLFQVFYNNNNNNQNS